MIDSTVKSMIGGQRQLKKAKALSNRKHDAINLPKNLEDSDSEGYEDKSSSDDENYSDGFYYDETASVTNELSSTLVNLVLSGRESAENEAFCKLVTLFNKYKVAFTKAGYKDKHLKARSPYRNKLLEHKKNTQYDLDDRKELHNHDVIVTTSHGNVGRVFLKAVKPVELQADTHVCDLVAALEDPDFMATFKKLTEEELTRVFERFISQQEGQMQQESVLSPAVRMVRTVSPANLDQYDSSYETGSPCSTVMTSPGSFSPPHTSISSESDQELDISVEVKQPWTNIVILTPATLTTPRKIVPTMRPLGEAVSFIQTSATDRLEELHNSTNFCLQHFSIQLVRVIMSAKGQAASDQVEGFCKSLLSTMKIKIGNRAHEGDIWQMSILAHVQYLLARIPLYRPALQRRDERGHTVLYIAAVEQHKKPVIARYIAESMLKVGYNPLEQVDEQGNTIIHTLAELGDTHVHVLSDLMLACGPESGVVVNNSKQSPLHLAVQSQNIHLTTTLVLLKMGANPFQQDSKKMTPFHYHIKQIASHEPRLLEDMEVVRKMLQVPVALDKDSLQSLEVLHADSSIPSDLNRVILEEVNKYYRIKDLRPKKNERR